MAAYFAFLGMLFIASSTDVVANFFHISLNLVLWAMRFLVILIPLITYPVTYYLCKELQAADGGKRKRANVVSRTVSGEYVATESAERPGDGHHELEAEPVPDFIELEPSDLVGAGVRQVGR